MADDDANAREEDHEVDEAAPEVPSDEVAAALLERFPA